MRLSDRFLDRVEAVLARLFSGVPSRSGQFPSQRDAGASAGASGLARGRDKACRLANHDAGSFEPVKDATAARRCDAASLTGSKAPEQSTLTLRDVEPAPKPFPTESFGPTEQVAAAPLPNPLIPHLRREAMMGGPHGLRAFLALLEQPEHGISDRDLHAIGIALCREWETERRAAIRPAPLSGPLSGPVSGRPAPFTVIDGGAA